ncbi:hypothetical protein ACVBGC_11820 [Burkholderia stagnalis]
MGEQMTEGSGCAFRRGQVAPWKIPRRIRFVDAVPTTVTGKKRKFVTRRWTIDACKLKRFRST